MSEADITLTEAAVKRIHHVLEKEGHGVGIRISIVNTGCSGLGYHIDVLDEPVADDKVISDPSGIQIAVESKNYDVVKGSKIDCVREGLAERLVFNNPNQTGECGCGESFTVD